MGHLYVQKYILLDSNLRSGSEGSQSRAYARGGLGLKPLLELDILQKFYYLRKEINCFYILFAC